MTSTEQPPKKRKPYDPPQPVPASAEPEALSPQTKSNAPISTLSQEEIARKRRNQEEIRNFYESYKRLKYCVDQKDAHLMPELEQAYLSLITASRGCTSVQRLVAEFVPKYASYCPTALEAAAKVCINIHNWSVQIINRGEDADGFSFEIARTCIFGLATTICQAASSETPTSSVIQGICSAVFLNVLSFFISSFEGQGIFQIVNKDVTKIYDSPKTFSELKEKFSDEDVAASVKLSKFRALCILWIFFSCPRNSLAACFELCSSNSIDAVSNGGQYFLNQVTARLDPCDVVYPLNGNSIGVKLTGSVESSSEVKKVICDGQVSTDKALPQDACYGSQSCLLGLVLDKDPSLRQWIFSKVKSISKSASPNVVSDITSALERIFESFTEQVKAEDKQLDSDENDISPSKFIHRQFLVPRTSNQHRPSEVSVREGSYPGDAADQLSGLHLEHHSSITPETDIRSNTSSNNSGGPRSMDLDSVDHRELPRASSSTPRNLSNNLKPSSMPGTSSDLGSKFDGRNHAANTENHSSRLENDVPALNASSGGVNSTSESPKHHLPSPYPSTGQPCWHFDGDRAAMDIYSASRHLWLGSLGPEASEALVRFQFERFGPIDNILYLPFKGFAVIEYKNIMDAIKAREVMRGRSPWGARLLIKFLDIGLGTRGDMNGVAIGSCCHVYVGNVRSQSDKDEILYELRKVLFKGPLAVNDLMSEGALLMEFGTPEEAATVMAHLRQHRKERRDFLPSLVVGPVNSIMPADRSSHGSASLHVDLRNNNLGSAIVSSPHAQTITGFSHCGQHNTPTMEQTSPQINMINQGATMQSGYAFQSNWRSFGVKGMLDTGTRKGDTYDTSMVMDSSQAGGHIASGTPEQNWTYRKPESVPQSTPGSMAGISTPIHGHNCAPSQPIRASSFMRPMYYPPNSSWDARGMIHHMPLNPIPGVMHGNLHNNAVAPPFIPASVTPLAQIQGNSLPQHDQMFYVPPPLTTMPPPQPDFIPPLPPQLNMPPPLPPQRNMPPPLPPHPSLPPPLPIHPELPPPLPPSPPPLLDSQPPPPPPPIESSMLGSGGYWQGTLSKSGVHYSTIHARKLHSDACNYADNISEPAEWPTKLDITKRTDFRHVMSTFSSTPPHKREVCQLFPTSAGDHKGFEDFISYLKQRECAGVIKIAATKSVWARLVFILPYSHEICSLLSVTPDTADCLIALVLPKETNFEWV